MRNFFTCQKHPSHKTEGMPRSMWVEGRQTLPKTSPWPKPYLPRWSAPCTFHTGQQANYLFCTAVSTDQFRAHELAWVVQRAVQLLALLTVLRARALAYRYGTSRASALSVCHEDVGALVSWPMLQTKYLLMYFRAASLDAKNLSMFCFYRCYHKSLSLSNEFQ